MGRSERARRLDEREPHHLEHRATDNPCERRRNHDADRDHRVAPVRPEQPGDHDREHEPGQREHEVDEAHQDAIEPAAEEAGEQAERDPEHEGDADGDHSHLQRHLGAVDDAGQGVAPEARPSPWGAPRSAAEVVSQRLVGVDRPDVGTEGGNEEVEAHDHSPGDPDRVPPLRELRRPSRGGVDPGSLPYLARALRREDRALVVGEVAHSCEILGSSTP